MGQPAARVTDMHTCPLCSGPVPHVGGPILPGQVTVLVGGLPASRSTDQLTCVGGTDVIALGSFAVFINKLPAARMGDVTGHGGLIAAGCPRVLIG
ncbi:MAG: PAAR domain-containing protein [Acetobacteraceae bacterium]